MGRVVGIDLGTTNSVVAIADGREPRVLENRESRTQTRSAVGVKKARQPNRPDEILVGDAALDNWAMAPADTIVSVKRLMGRGVADAQVQKVKTWAPYAVVAPEKGTDDSVRVVMGGKPYSPVEISALILKKLKEDAEFRLGEPVTHAVITVPAYFNQIQRDATRKAGAQAGLKVIRLLDEPTAAAIAFGMESPGNPDTKYVLVFDLGGGTFDVSILLWSGAVFAPLNLEGDMWLGGDNFDQLLVQAAVDRVRSEHGVDPRQNVRFMAALRREAQVLKERLTSSGSAEMVVPGLLRKGDEVVDFAMELTRLEFERLIHPLVDRAIAIVHTALQNAGLGAEQIDHVIVAGNATSIPLVQRSIELLFGPHKLCRLVHPKHGVAIGAAILASRLGPVVACACGHVNDEALTKCGKCGRPLSGEGAPPPADGFVHGGIAPFHYGIQTFGDRFTPFIKKSDPYPTDKKVTHTFYTHIPNQRMFCLPVYCGDALDKATKNEKAGEAFGILVPGLPQETPIRIKLWLDEDGVFDLSAHLEDGTNLAPWIMKGETDARAFKAIELSDDVIASRRGATGLTPAQLAELEKQRNKALDKIKDGDFTGALEEAEQLIEKAKSLGVQAPLDTASRATMLINYTQWMLKRFPWAFEPDRAGYFRTLCADVSAALRANDAAKLATLVPVLDRESDLLPEGTSEINDAEIKINRRIAPVDVAAGADLTTRLKHAEEAYIRKAPDRSQQLGDVRRRIDSTLRDLPANKVPCRCGAMLSGERFCKTCGGDSWLVDGPRTHPRSRDLPDEL